MLNRISLSSERSVKSVPAAVIVLFAIGLGLQISWHSLRPPPQGEARALPLPPPVEWLEAASLGEPEVMAKLLNLWLQAFDNQPGISIPFSRLDYETVIRWLDTILTMDPRGPYPLLAASRVYAEVPVADKQRQMLNFVHDRFLEDPDNRWPWLAHGVYVARHRLGDTELALKYANAIAEYATGPTVPHWAQQMNIFVLEQMGDVESAKVLLGGLLESGAITDPAEFRFLENRLKEMEEVSTADQ